MGLEQILVFSAAALLVAAVARQRSRLLLILSVLALYWLQPALTIRGLDFWLPTATLGLVVITWAVTRPAGEPWLPADGWSAAWIAALVLGLAANRYFSPCCLTPSRPPDIWLAALALLAIALLALGLTRLRSAAAWNGGLLFAILVLIFVILKTDPLAAFASAGLRSLSGQQVNLASALDLRWLGFSYVAFRLIHTLRDRSSGRLPSLSLEEFIVYAIFFPAITAGPIDRVQRFTQDLRKPFNITLQDAWEGGQRIVWGVFKKFALADSLALVALNGTNAQQTQGAIWFWLLLYAYALRIYLDFSGYTDIALGLGRFLGFRLPENFETPYLKTNLTLFWNSWHMTLAQWFRAYFFNPVTRALRSSKRSIPMPLIILVGQLGTMLLIGLWHGVTWNFLIWGLWHGLGLFAHNRWQEFSRSRGWEAPVAGSAVQRLLDAGGAIFTFHYVALGWVWFALPSTTLSWRVLLGLFGG